jgi:zinc transporter, ZIP family
LDPQTQSFLEPFTALLPRNSEVFWLGATASFLAGLGTSIGAFGIFLLRKPSTRTLNALISGAAGVMLTASFFSLLQPAIEYAEARATHNGLGTLVVIAGLFAGAGMLFSIHRYSPHEHFEMGREGPQGSRISRIWLFVVAITLHNFPEGMTVGVGFAGENIANGLALGVGIGAQNIPEGLAVSVSLLAVGYGKWRAFWIGSLTGLVEPVGGIFGAAAIWLAEPAIPIILGIAAGAMLFIISHEVIPETHRGPDKNLATFSLLTGVVLMLSPPSCDLKNVTAGPCVFPTHAALGFLKGLRSTFREY